MHARTQAHKHEHTNTQTHEHKHKHTNTSTRAYAHTHARISTETHSSVPGRRVLAPGCDSKLSALGMAREVFEDRGLLKLPCIEDCLVLELASVVELRLCTELLCMSGGGGEGEDGEAACEERLSRCMLASIPGLRCPSSCADSVWIFGSVACCKLFLLFLSGAGAVFAAAVFLSLLVLLVWPGITCRITTTSSLA